MKTRKILMGAGAVVLSLGLTIPASALTVQGVTDTTADVSGQLTNTLNVDGSAGVSGSVNANSTSTTNPSSVGVSGSGNVDVDGKVNGNGRADDKANAGFGASIKAMLSALVNGSSSSANDADTANGNTDGSASGTNGSASGSAGIGGSVSTALKTILVTRADVDNGSVTATSDNAASVRSENDLRGYVAAQLESDSNIEAIELASHSVAVTYKEKARLFAVIPVTVDATATVDANGNVEVSYPWYSFLMSTGKDELEAKIENRVSAVLLAMTDVSADVSAAANAAANGSVTAGEDGISTEADANATAEAAARLSAEAQARIVAEVRSAMAEALAEAEGATDIDASANTNVNADGSVDVR